MTKVFKMKYFLSCFITLGMIATAQFSEAAGLEKGDPQEAKVVVKDANQTMKAVALQKSLEELKLLKGGIGVAGLPTVGLAAIALGAAARVSAGGGGSSSTTSSTSSTSSTSGTN